MADGRMLTSNEEKAKKRRLKLKLDRSDKTKKERHKIKLKRGDMVQVIAGKEVGRTGKILLVDRVKERVIVEDLNMQTKHQKPNRANQTGGITRKEASIHVSNVMYLHKDQPTRLGYREVEVNGEKVKKRYAKSTKEIID
jgi:large subunit ribosomal protein L24